MAFDEIQFPADISYGSSGGPVYSVDIVTNAGGYEQRVSNWSEPLARYDVSHGVRSEAQLQELINFFHARNGMARGFRFKDWTDYQATGQSIGIGDDTTTDFQLIKSYSSGSETQVRTIKKPVTGTVKIYFDSVEKLSGFTIDTTTGIVTFDTAPTTGVSITADFEFDVPVRFATNQLQVTMQSFGAYAWNNIPLVEVRK